MKRAVIITILCTVSVSATARIILDVFESDGKTPYDDRNIRVGTQLKLIVASDANDLWSGGLFLSESNRSFAQLSSSGKDPNSRDYSDGHLLEAGSSALVTRWEDSLIEGFDLFSGTDCVPGNWFQIEYTAIAPGDPNVGLYEYQVSWDDPNDFVTFHQVPRADFNADGLVNFPDYSLLASCWLQNDCNDPNGCKKVDLNSDGVVDMNDLMLFSDDWLWGAPEPNIPDEVIPVADPNLIYRIVDANGFNEISIDIGETVTLYVDMFTYDANEVWAFGIEVNISDPNLGIIDNTPYDPNNPPGPGTARILAGPDRWTAFDYWGPGRQQPQGIYFYGLSGWDAFEDGYLASFEYTAQYEGDVILNLINWETSSTDGGLLYPTLESIMIHQSDPNEQMMMASSGMEAASMSVSEESTSIMSSKETIQFLEEIWIQEPDIQKTINEDDWNELIEAVANSY